MDRVIFQRIDSKKKGKSMKRKLMVWSLMVSIMTLLFAAGVVMADQGNDFRALEEAGLEISPTANASSNNGTIPMIDSIPPEGVLLIPESLDDFVGMYNPYDGTFLGNLIDGTGLFSTPIDAIRGPDGNIYVSDQVADAIFVFDTDGAYLSTYADASDGLDNIRGIDFRNDTLFVTTIHTYVARFAGPHNRIADFFSGAGAFDILFLDDGRSLLTSHASPNGVQLYDVDGNLISQIVGIDFPEQVLFDDLNPGDYLNASFGDNYVAEFDISGTIHQTTPFNNCRGVFRLGNGNILATNSGGVYELEPGSGNVIQQENTGSGRFIELFKPDVTGLEQTSQMPEIYSLAQNYPNPFNASTNIRFLLPEKAEVSVEIYNLLGQKVVTLLEGELPAGNHSVTWDASDVSSGIYYYRLTADNQSSIKRMTLLK